MRGKDNPITTQMPPSQAERLPWLAARGMEVGYGAGRRALKTFSL